MNYCSLEDAWGRSNIPSNQFNQYMDNKFSETESKSCKTNKKVEHFNETKKSPKRMINYYDDDYEEAYGCDNFFNHIKNCRRCYNRVKNQVKPHILENFQEMVDGNKDTIVLILVGIFILLFFNLINNITK